MAPRDRLVILQMGTAGVVGCGVQSHDGCNQSILAYDIFDDQWSVFGGLEVEVDSNKR